MVARYFHLVVSQFLLSGLFFSYCLITSPSFFPIIDLARQQLVLNHFFSFNFTFSPISAKKWSFVWNTNRRRIVQGKKGPRRNQGKHCIESSTTEFGKTKAQGIKELIITVKERELQQSRTDVIKYQKERMIRSKELAETRNSLLRRTKEVRELKGVWGFGHDLLAKVISYYHLSNQLHRFERLLDIWIFSPFLFFTYS